MAMVCLACFVWFLLLEVFFFYFSRAIGECKCFVGVVIRLPFSLPRFLPPLHSHCTHFPPPLVRTTSSSYSMRPFFSLWR
ncbi:MAG: hypothetical protein JOS17DRAFT_730507 [Linnemannia elongata]|nr:MAG: hypothetical protein JOS17DRAFT_730507 [Linnemannia elongata]